LRGAQKETMFASIRHNFIAGSEEFVGKGVNPSNAYVCANYPAKGASLKRRQNASECFSLLPNSGAAGGHFRGYYALEISYRNARVRALQNWWDRLCDGLDKMLTEPGANMAEMPGGSPGY